MTPWEYRLRIKAYQLKFIDREYELHKLAFLNYAVKSVKKQGKERYSPKYDTFDKFFDYEKILGQFEANYSKKSDARILLSIAKNLKNYREGS